MRRVVLRTTKEESHRQAVICGSIGSTREAYLRLKERVMNDMSHFTNLNLVVVIL